MKRHNFISEESLIGDIRDSFNVGKNLGSFSEKQLSDLETKIKKLTADQEKEVLESKFGCEKHEGLARYDLEELKKESVKYSGFFVSKVVPFLKGHVLSLTMKDIKEETSKYLSICNQSESLYKQLTKSKDGDYEGRDGYQLHGIPGGVNYSIVESVVNDFRNGSYKEWYFRSKYDLLLIPSTVRYLLEIGGSSALGRYRMIRRNLFQQVIPLAIKITGSTEDEIYSNGGPFYCISQTIGSLSDIFDGAISQYAACRYLPKFLLPRLITTVNRIAS